MAKRVRYFFFRRLLNSWSMVLTLSLIALIAFICDYFLQISLLLGLAGVFGGAALTFAITLVIGKEAVREQNAKEANIARKDTYYIPIFNELKRIYDIFEEARQKRLPYPQWIGGVTGESRQMVWHRYPMPSFTQWVIYREDPYRSNFTEKAYKLFNGVYDSIICYNKVVGETKDPVVKILNPRIDNAFREWANRDDFKHWREETNGGSAWSSLQYHDWNLYIYRYLQRPDLAELPEAQALVWAHNILGWVLVDDIDKASDSMQKIYQNDFQTRTSPDITWFKSILEGIWTELQEHPHIKEVHVAADDLFAKTIQVKGYMQSRLTYIRDMYEGGEPPL